MVVHHQKITNLHILLSYLNIYHKVFVDAYDLTTEDNPIHGARLSFILAISISAINLTIGAFFGAVEGYYGGKIDLFMERISDILSAVPSMIVITLLKYHFSYYGGRETLPHPCLAAGDGRG